MLCFIDGEIGKAPPPPPPPATPWPSFDRAVIGIVQGQPDLFIAGYRSNLPIQAP